jgi:hypothetical protein
MKNFVAVVAAVVLVVEYVIVMVDSMELCLIDYLKMKNLVVDYAVVLVDLIHHLLFVVHLK